MNLMTALKRHRPKSPYSNKLEYERRTGESWRQRFIASQSEVGALEKSLTELRSDFSIVVNIANKHANTINGTEVYTRRSGVHHEISSSFPDETTAMEDESFDDYRIRVELDQT